MKKLIVSLVSAAVFSFVFGCGQDADHSSQLTNSQREMIRYPGVIVSLVESPVVKADLAEYSSALEVDLFKILRSSGFKTQNAMALIGALNGTISCYSVQDCDVVLTRLQSLPEVSSASYDRIMSIPEAPVTRIQSQFPQGVATSISVLVTLTDSALQTHSASMKRLATSLERPTFRTLFQSGMLVTNGLVNLGTATGYLSCLSAQQCNSLLQNLQHSPIVKSVSYEGFMTLARSSAFN